MYLRDKLLVECETPLYQSTIYISLFAVPLAYVKYFKSSSDICGRLKYVLSFSEWLFVWQVIMMSI